MSASTACARRRPATRVKAGDVLTIGLDRTVRVLKVIGFAERRGDAPSARVLYVDLQEPAGVTICLRPSLARVSGKACQEALCFTCG